LPILSAGRLRARRLCKLLIGRDRSCFRQNSAHRTCAAKREICHCQRFLQPANWRAVVGGFSGGSAGNTLQGGVLVLDRVLMVLIIAEIAATLRAVLLYHEIAAEPFLFIGLIACVRRILIVTAASEQVHSDKELDRLLFELGALGLLIIGIAAAIYMIRCSARHTSQTHDDA
jgi:uncharacterized membrane protein (DUF373 family)